MTIDDFDGLPALAEPALLVLVSLSSGPRHGYAISQDVEAFAGIRLGPGTLYAALSRLEERGLIESLPATDRRRPYRLTGRGEQALARRLHDLDELARVGLRRIARLT